MVVSCVWCVVSRGPRALRLLSWKHQKYCDEVSRLLSVAVRVLRQYTAVYNTMLYEAIWIFYSFSSIYYLSYEVWYVTPRTWLWRTDGTRVPSAYIYIVYTLMKFYAYSSITYHTKYVYSTYLMVADRRYSCTDCCSSSELSLLAVQIYIPRYETTNSSDGVSYLFM